jgi:hypothetical protein
MKTKRQSMREERKKKKLLTRIGWITTLLIILSAIGYGAFASARPAVGEEVQVMADISHVPEGTDPGPYNTDPPSSGRHYPSSLPAGFYFEGDIEDPYPAGLLVHSLEHGYIIFWYNCSILTPEDCTDLQAQISEVMERADNFKVIAYPWESINSPVVMTSWGRMRSFDQFDLELALEFIQRNRNKAPEPHAD